MGNIQTLPDYLLPIKNRVLLEIFESGRVGYSLPNGYGQWPSLESFRHYIIIIIIISIIIIIIFMYAL